MDWQLWTMAGTVALFIHGRMWAARRKSSSRSG
jgi:hypothetical protein